MDRNSRVDLMQKIAASAGILTSFVEKNLSSNSPGKSNFKDQYLKTPPGQAREALVYNELIKRGPPKQLVPITVNGPNGIKITYKVMPDYVMIDGVRVTMAPLTAQKVADHFNMSLPTDKMSKQIYDAADTKIRATPLSSSGYTGADGKHYSAKDVVENRINQSDAVLEYNRLTDEEIEKYKQQTGKTPTLIAGHGKDMLQPMSGSSDPSMGGWQGAGGVPLQPYSSPHKGQAGVHGEYGYKSRFVDNNITITMPDGKTVSMSLRDLQNDPELSRAIANKPGLKRYDLKV